MVYKVLEGNARKLTDLSRENLVLIDSVLDPLIKTLLAKDLQPEEICYLVTYCTHDMLLDEVLGLNKIKPQEE